MSDKHVVFGTGQVGHALIGQLAGSGYDVRAVSLHRPTELPEDVDWRGADVTDPEAAADAAKGASTSINASTLRTPSGPNCSPRCRGGCSRPLSAPMRCS